MWKKLFQTFLTLPDDEEHTFVHSKENDCLSCLPCLQSSSSLIFWNDHNDMRNNPKETQNDHTEMSNDTK